MVLSQSSVSGTYDNSDCGERKTITLQNLTLTKNPSIAVADDVTGNYQLSPSLTVTGNITPLQLRVTVNPPNQTTFNKVYDGTVNFSIPSGTTYSLSNSTVGTSLPANVSDIEVNTSNITATYDNGNVGVGKIITFTGLSLKKQDTAIKDVSGNYSIPRDLITAGSISVGAQNQLVVTVKLGGANPLPTKTYDGTNDFNIPSGTKYELSGSVFAPDKLSDIAVDDSQGILAYYNNIHVGSDQTVTFKNLKLKPSSTATKDISSNYAIASPVIISGAIITPKPLNVTVNFPAGYSLSKVYNAVNNFNIPANTTYALNSNEIALADRGNIEVNSGSVVAEYNSIDAGTGKIITFKNLSLQRPIGVTKDVTGDYVIAGNPSFSNGVITAKPVNITPTGSFTKVYDGNNRFDLNTTAVNFRSGDIEVVDQSKVTLSTSGAVAVYDNPNVGSRSVTISGLSIAGTRKDNYVLNLAQYTISNCSITARNVNVLANPQAKEYGANDPPLSYNAPELVTGESLSGRLSRVGGEVVINSPYEITQGTLTNINNPNYNISYRNNHLIITKAVLNVTANSYEKIQDQPNPTFDVSYSGFKFNDSSSLIKDRVTISTAAKVDSPIGNYTINVNGPSNIDNYIVNYVNGTLRIKSLFPQLLSARDSLIATLNESNITIDALNNLLNANAINAPNSSYILNNKINYVVNNLIFLNNNSVAFRKLKLLMFPIRTRSLADFFGIRDFNVGIDEGYINIIRNIY